MSFSDDEGGDPGVSPKKAQPPIDFRSLIAATNRFYWIIPLAMVVAVACAIAYLKFSEPVYRSTAEIKIESRAGAQSLSLTGNASLAEEAITFEDIQTFEHSFLNF